MNITCLCTYFDGDLYIRIINARKKVIIKNFSDNADMERIMKRFCIVAFQ